MMGRFAFLMNVSLDGGAGWLRIDEEPQREFDARARARALTVQRSLKQGVTMHRYAIRDESEASPC
jgi:hypothetical protein